MIEVQDLVLLLTVQLYLSVLIVDVLVIADLLMSFSKTVKPCEANVVLIGLCKNDLID